MGATAASPPAGKAAHAAPAVVLDTNVVLDWLLFKDPRIAALAEAVQGRKLRWLSCARMREELQRTLGYAVLAKWNPDSVRVLTLFDTWSELCAAPAASHVLLRCDDPDDQVFLDLALVHGARWLISHDRALLRLRRRASALGLTILPPQAWPPAMPA